MTVSAQSARRLAETANVARVELRRGGPVLAGSYLYEGDLLVSVEKLPSISLEQSVATDLRMVLAAMRISPTLERMGDLEGALASFKRARDLVGTSSELSRAHEERVRSLEERLARKKK